MDNLTSMFADDTKLYATLTDVVNSDGVNSPISLQEDLTELQDWFTTMQI